MSKELIEDENEFKKRFSKVYPSYLYDCPVKI